MINKRDVGTIIRYLGYFPSEEDIKQFIMPQLNELLQNNRNNVINNQEVLNTNQDDDSNKQEDDGINDKQEQVNINKNTSMPLQTSNENEIDYITFEAMMLEIMKRNLYPCDDEETILNAFKVIQNHFQNETFEANQIEPTDDDDKILYKNDVRTAMREFGDEYCLDSRELDEFLNMAITTTNKNNKNVNKDQNGDNNEVIYYEDYVDELFLELRDHA